MHTREQLIHKRIIHVVIIIVTAFFIAQFCNWSDALWICISALAIIGPFSPGGSINKAKQRLLGSIAGLLLSVFIWLFFQYFPNTLPVVTVFLIYGVAFCLLQEYTFFIMLVSIMLCVNFDYMNLFFNTEVAFLFNRIICVFTGVAICQFYEYFVFRHSYNNIVLVEKERLDQLIISRWECINKYAVCREDVDATDIDKCINPIIQEMARLEELKADCKHSYSDNTATILLIDNYLEKLSSIYLWLSSQAYNVISRQYNNSALQSVTHANEMSD